MDIVVRNGVVHDGTGAAPVRAAIGIADGRIAAIGEIEVMGRREIDAAGLIVAPGFIDIHSHSDYTLLVDPRALSAIHQGVTLEVIGNCGFGCAPIADRRLAGTAIYGFDDTVPLSWRGVGEYLERLERARTAVNVMTLVPNGQLRLAAVGLSEEPADPAQTDTMRRLLREGLAEGAHGYSVGLEYPAERGAPPRELVALAREAGRAGGLFATHTRRRAEAAAEAVEEVIAIARAAEVRLQVSHIVPRSGVAESRRCIDAVDAARAAGQDVAFDMHTRLFGTTMLSTLLPSWALVDGEAGLRRHLAREDSRARMKTYPSIATSVGDWERVVLLSVPRRPELSRLSLAEIGRRMGRDPHDAALDLLAEEAASPHRIMMILHSYDAQMQKEAFAHPLCMPGSDATTLAPDGPLAGKTFHGAYSWASWYWRAMVRDWRLLRAEEAIHRLTGLPASILNLSDRGTIRVGARADLAIFDPESFGERATTFEPNILAAGMRHVIVNGVPTLADGAPTGARAGAVLRRAGAPIAF
jgi:N-acyl-D-aspartate/D-glutamate deacylase